MPCVVLFLLFLLLGTFSQGNSGDFAWHKIRTKSGTQPRGRFDVLTWVDDQKQLWLFSGATTVVGTNGSKVEKRVHDLWRFNPGSCEWNKIAHRNSSKYPHLGKRLSCFCHGRAFVFGQNIHKKKQELWVYNISSNFWNLIHAGGNMIDMNDCFTLWCSNNSQSVMLLCRENGRAVKLWIFNIKSISWESQNITNDVESRNASVNNISQSSQFSVWNSPGGLVFIYVWSYSAPNMAKESMLLSIAHDNVMIAQVKNTETEYMSNRNGFVRWIDSLGNLHFLGGKITSLTMNTSAVHWMLNRSDYTWVRKTSQNPKPSPRSGAGFWQVGNNLWMFGGYRKDGEGRTVVLNDFWIRSNTSKPAVPLPTPVNRDLPGDTLGLSLANKLIISMVTLCVVMAVSIRLCYKRELNQLISRLRKNRVLYHQLSQEGDKSTRL